MMFNLNEIQTSHENPEIEAELSRIRSLSLSDMLRNYIASIEGISPDEVTLDYILEKRIKHLYPTIRYDIDSPRGGYSTLGLTVYTRNELEQIDRNADEILRRYSQ